MPNSNLQKVIVAGDTIIDRLLIPNGHPSRARKTFDVEREIRLGGVWNSVRALQTVGISTQVFTALPRALDRNLFESHLHVSGSSLHCVGHLEFPIERLWLELGNELIQINNGDRYSQPLPAAWEEPQVTEEVPVLIQDYGHGVANTFAARLPRTETIVWDGHIQGPKPSPGVTFVANSAYLGYTGIPSESIEPVSLVKSLQSFVGRYQLRGALATLAHMGALGYHRDFGSFFCPMMSASIRKFIGAGDVFSAMMLFNSIQCDDLRDATRRAVLDTAKLIRGKGVIGRISAPLAREITAIPLVATAGCFDLLHSGHLALLEACRALGDRTVVLLNSDQSIKRIKDASRPIQSSKIRADRLYDTGLVDRVEIFDENDPCAALEYANPQIYIKGSDYRSYEIPEYRVMNRLGGVVLTVPRLPNFSTSQVINHLRHDANTRQAGVDL